MSKCLKRSIEAASAWIGFGNQVSDNTDYGRQIPLMARRRLSLIALCLALSSLSLADRTAADTRSVVQSKDGSTIVLVVEGKEPRQLPKPTIVVCSDGSQDDVGALNRVTRSLLPAERYAILDAKQVSENFDFSNATIAYFGPPPDQSSPLPCLNIVPGFSSYISLWSTLRLQLIKNVHERYKKQFRTENDVFGPGLCAPHGPQSVINGQWLNWSPQIRNPANRRCPMSYWRIFGISKLCLTDKCLPDEEYKVFEDLK